MSADIALARTPRFAVVQPMTEKGSAWLRYHAGRAGPYGEAAVLPLPVALAAVEAGLVIEER